MALLANDRRRCHLTLPPSLHLYYPGLPRTLQTRCFHSPPCPMPWGLHSPPPSPPPDPA